MTDRGRTTRNTASGLHVVGYPFGPFNFERFGGNNGLARQRGIAVVKVQHEPNVRSYAGLAARDITAEVNAAVRETGIQTGIACVYSAHPTSCVRVNELETGLLEDFAALLRRLIPGDPASLDYEERRAQCVSMFLGPAGESIPVSGGELLIGRWQRVLFVELGGDADGDWHVEVVGTS